MSSTAPGSPAAQRVLKPNVSIWVSGTSTSSIPSARMQQLGFKLLNDISWVKPILLPISPAATSPRHRNHHLAARTKSPAHFHYKLMKETNRGKQMKSVWEIRRRILGRALR